MDAKICPMSVPYDPAANNNGSSPLCHFKLVVVLGGRGHLDLYNGIYKRHNDVLLLFLRSSCLLLSPLAMALDDLDLHR